MPVERRAGADPGTTGGAQVSQTDRAVPEDVEWQRGGRGDVGTHRQGGQAEDEAARGAGAPSVSLDNAKSYRTGKACITACDQLGRSAAAQLPGRAYTKSKAEPFRRALPGEWAYATAWTSNDQRKRRPGQLAGAVTRLPAATQLSG
jgi:hypothetical protein